VRPVGAYQIEHHPGTVPSVATEQIAVRVPTGHLEALDDLVERGVFGSRAAAVRAAIDVLVDLDRRHRDDLAVIEGYRRIPQTDGETSAAIASLRDAIADEPW
jgi:Arc/MetJ-type ribon-helix-helix transcriptional regulator